MSWAVAAAESVVSNPTRCETIQTNPVCFSLPFSITSRQSPRRRFVILLLLTDCGENAGCHSPAHRPIGFRAR